MSRYSIALLTTLAYLIVPSYSQQPISKADNIEARSIIIYNLNPLVEMPNGSYTNSFIKINMNTIPVFTYGINNYNVGDALYTQQFFPVGLVVSPNGFTLTLATGAQTTIRMYSVSYISIWNDDSFIVRSFEITPTTNVTTGTGDRIFSIFLSVPSPFESIAVVPIPFISGFRYSTSTRYSILISVQIVSTDFFRVDISTTSNCHISYVSANTLFYYSVKLLQKNYHFKADTSSFGSLNNTNAAMYSRQTTYYQSTVFIIGLRGFSGLTVSSSDIIFGWSISYNSTVSTSATIKFQFTNFQTLQYSYFQIGKKVVTQASSSGDSTGSFIPIIIGLVFGIVFLAVGFVVVMKKCRAKQIFNVSLEKDDLRALPSFNFT